MAQNYGFIGLGQMGYPMCINIQAKIPAESKLYICDVNQHVLDRFMAEAKGKAEITILKTPKEVAEYSDAIITMLPRGEHVRDVFYTDENNLLSMNPTKARSRDKKLFIDCSTIDAAISREVGEEVRKSGLGDFSDAAVSGGPMGARDATLTHMIGCDAEIVDNVKAVVSMTGKSLFHCGPIGAGVGVKLINNYLAACSVIASSEALNIGVKMGLDPKVLTDILNVSSGQCWVTSKNNPVPGVMPGPASNGYKGGFAIELATGVIDLAVKTAESVNAKMTLAPAVQHAFHSACEDPRCKGLDARVMYRWVSDTNAGAEEET